MLLRTNAKSEPFSATCGGVAILVRGAAVLPLDSCVQPVNSHRITAARVVLPGTGLTLLAFCIFSNSGQSPEVVARRAEVFEKALMLAAEWGTSPSLIVGASTSTQGIRAS